MAVKCDCRVCVANRQDIAHSRKYGTEHYEACMCDRCVRMYNDHNRHKTCACDDCVSHRAYLYNKDLKRSVERDIALTSVNKYDRVKTSGRKKSMSTINMCERCGAMAVSGAMGGISSWNSPNDAMNDAKELCPGCVGDLVEFMKGENVGDRPKNGYRKPWEAPKSGLGDISTEDLARALLSRQLEPGKTDQ